MLSKFVFTFILCSSALALYGQYRPDTTIRKEVLFDLRSTISYLKETVRLQDYALRLVKELARVDTTHNASDSLIVRFVSTTGKLLKTEKKIFKQGCVKDSIVKHYNRRGLPEYEECWRFNCDLDKVSAESNSILEGHWGYRMTYSRWEYDSLGRETKVVFHISTPQTRRIHITYLPDGTPIRKSLKIDYYEFWD